MSEENNSNQNNDVNTNANVKANTEAKDLKTLEDSRGKGSVKDFLVKWWLKRTTPPPQALTVEEIERLEQPTKLKKGLGIFFFVCGIALLITSLSLFIKRATVPGFVVSFAFKKDTLSINLSFIFSILVSYIGFWLVSRYSVNRNMLRQNTTYLPYISYRREQTDKESGTSVLKLRSFASSRFMASFLLVIMSLGMALQFGFAVTQENHVGSWFTLGGPSLFYPTAALPLLISVGLFLYVILSTSNMTFSRTANFFIVEEYRFMAPWKTEIPKDKVKAIRLTNANTGPKFLWVFVLGPLAYFLYVDGFYLITNPLNQDLTYMNASAYIIAGTVILIAMVLLTVKTQLYLEIVTDENYYELQFSPPAATPSVRRAIEELFEIPVMSNKSKETRTLQRDPDIEDNVETRFNNTNFKDFFQIAFGFILVLIGIVSQVNEIYLGQNLCLFLYLFGYLFIVRGYKTDFSCPLRPLQVVHIPTKNELYLRKEWAWFNESYRFMDISKDNYWLDNSIRKLDFWDVLAGMLLPLILGISAGITIPYSIPGTASESFPALHIGIGLLVTLAMAYYMVSPCLALKIKNDSLKYEFRLPHINFDEVTKKEYQKNIIERWKHAFTNYKIPTLIRICSVLASFIVGILIGALML